jgi:hypothetical protein
MHADAIPLALWLRPHELARVADWPWQFEKREEQAIIPGPPMPPIPQAGLRAQVAHAAANDHVLDHYRKQHEDRIKLVKCW